MKQTKNGIRTDTFALFANASFARSGARYLFFFVSAIILLSPSLHAAQDWKPAVLAAVLISVFVLAVVYMLVHVLHWDQFKGLIKDELGQTFITFLLVVLLIGGLPDAESAASRLVCGVSGMPDFCPASVSACSGTFTPGSVPPQCSLIFCKTADFSGGNATCPIAQPLNTWALALNSQGQGLLGGVLGKALIFNRDVGYVSSVSGFCNMLGVGFTVAGCAGYGAMRGAVGQLLNAIGIGMMDMQAEHILLEMNATGFTLSLLLPLGILLRALHWTRKAGGTLIALALSLYFIFPSALLLGQAMADQFIKPDTPASPTSPASPGSPYQNLSSVSFPTMGGAYNPLAPSTFECNPFDPKEDKMVSTMNRLIAPDPANGPAALLQNPSPVDQILFIVLIRNLFMTVVALTVTLSAVRVLGHALGAEIDVWGIARLS